MALRLRALIIVVASLCAHTLAEDVAERGAQEQQLAEERAALSKTSSAGKVAEENVSDENARLKRELENARLKEELEKLRTERKQQEAAALAKPAAETKAEAKAEAASEAVAQEAKVAPATLVKCMFTIDNVVDSVHYAGQDITEAVRGNKSDWTVEKHVWFTQTPGAYLVVTGHNEESDWDDACKSGGLQIKCSNGISGDSAWEAVGASYPIEPWHAEGNGVGWSTPCRSTSTFNLAVDPYTTKISRREKHYAFRITTDVTCAFTVDNIVDAVHYNGIDITSLVKGDKSNWTMDKHVSFMPVQGAYLAITGHNIESYSTDACSSGGLQINCSNSLTGGSGWEAVGSSEAVEAPYKSGGGRSWDRPCISTSGFHLAEKMDSTKISTPEKFYAFRIRADVVCTFTVDNAVDSVFYNGNDLTEIVTGDKDNWKAEKTIAFTPAEGAYLTITGHNFEAEATNGCRSGGMQIQCSNGISGGSGWQGHSDSKKISQPHVSGGGDGWEEPCSSTSNFNIADAAGTQKLGMKDKYYSFRFKIEYAEEYAQKEGVNLTAREYVSGHGILVVFMLMGVAFIGFFAYQQHQKRGSEVHGHDFLLG